MQVFSAQGTKRDRSKAYHLSAILKARKGHFCHGVLFVRRLLRGKKGSVGSKREVDTGEAIRMLQQPNCREDKKTNELRDKVGLELVQVDVEGAVEAERGSDG
jgi:hypothetical protein